MPLMEMAMVQVIENRTDIAGRVQAMREDPERPDHRVVTIEVHSAAPVEGSANMFANAAGTRIEVLVSADQSRALAPGKNVRCRIRRSGPATVFADSCATD
jgi:low affinity Fe/Cu permease